LGKRGDGLLITGPAGTGKTHLAAAIVRMLMEQGHRAVFRRSAEFYAALRETYGGGITERSVVRPLLEAPHLVFDDLGAGSLSDHERRFTLEVLDRRMNALLPTVLTTNWLLPEIAERIDDRVASRLAGFLNFQLSGPDRRLTLERSSVQTI
jgi:DNA replication protein DnaC